MSTHCTSCGNPVPAGQFRCGRCGAPQEDEELEAESDGEQPVDSEREAAKRDSPESPASDSDVAESAALGQSAVSLPPPPPEDEALEVDHGEADTSDSGRRSDPSEPFGREDDTEKRKIVPKGAFGEGSVADKLPATPEGEGEGEGETEEGDGRPKAARSSGAKPERSGEVTGKVARLPGLEPTRHADDADDADDEGDEEPATAGEEDGDAEEPEDDSTDDAPLELDVPSGGIRSLPNKPRPPFLASELMRDDIIPERPGAHAVARLSQGCGVAAVVAYMLMAIAQPDATAWGVPALVLLALGVANLRFVPRAAGLAALAVGTLVACLSAGHVPAASRHASYLPFVVLWLSASLLLRFWYRGHRQPPWLVALGVTAAGALGVSALSDAGAWVLTAEWQTWLPALTGLLYLQLCLLSLFAFMGPETNAAGATWALAWWGWYAAAHVILSLAHATPEGRGGLSLDVVADALTHSGLITAFVLPPGAFALAQLYAVALSRHEPAAADDPHITPA